MIAHAMCRDVAGSVELCVQICTVTHTARCCSADKYTSAACKATQCSTQTAIRTVSMSAVDMLCVDDTVQMKVDSTLHSECRTRACGKGDASVHNARDSNTLGQQPAHYRDAAAETAAVASDTLGSLSRVARDSSRLFSSSSNNTFTITAVHLGHCWCRLGCESGIIQCQH